MKPESATLSWAFWLVAFAPAIAASAGDTVIAAQRLSGMESFNLMMWTSSMFGLALNMVCSPLAGLRYAKHRKPTTWRAVHVVAFTLLFFVMNLLLLPAGCVVAGGVSKVIGK